MDCSHSSMDRTGVCGTSDASSILAGSTKYVIWIEQGFAVPHMRDDSSWEHVLLLSYDFRKDAAS